nr:MAG TPA: hypothetical protein [Caudoviricetes sp.]
MVTFWVKTCTQFVPSFGKCTQFSGYMAENPTLRLQTLEILEFKNRGCTQKTGYRTQF